MTYLSRLPSCTHWRVLEPMATTSCVQVTIRSKGLWLGSSQCEKLAQSLKLPVWPKANIGGYQEDEPCACCRSTGGTPSAMQPWRPAMRPSSCWTPSRRYLFTTAAAALPALPARPRSRACSGVRSSPYGLRGGYGVCLLSLAAHALQPAAQASDSASYRWHYLLERCWRLLIKKRGRKSV